MTSNLATQLREGTSKSHTMAENVNFIKSFLGGVIDKSSYVEMLSKLFFVYEAIEKAMEENKKVTAASCDRARTDKNKRKKRSFILRFIIECK